MTHPHDIVIDIGNSEIVVASYSGDERESLLRVGAREGWQEWLVSFLDDQIEEAPVRAMAASVNPDYDEPVRQIFRQNDLDLAFLTPQTCTVKLDVEAPAEVGADRIANTYAALKRFPGRNVIVVDIGTAVAFDAVSHEGAFVGGAIAPGPGLQAQALGEHTGLLPNIELSTRERAISRSTKGNIASGVFYGLVGGIQLTVTRMAQELRERHPDTPLSIVATGGILGDVGEAASEQLHQFSLGLRQELAQFVDAVEPELTLNGIHTALKEQAHEHTA